MYLVKITEKRVNTEITNIRSEQEFGTIQHPFMIRHYSKREALSPLEKEHL